MADNSRGLLVQASVDDNTYNTILDITDVDMRMSGNNSLITTFGESFENRLQGIKDVSYVIRGNYNSADSTGQIRLRTAFLNDTVAYIKVLWDGSAGYKQQVKVQNFQVIGSVIDDKTIVTEVRMELQGTDTLSVV